jgi:myo-inositol 2-dehydrogenase/D-chiro-inositol 1-dehydrogenase
MKIGIIGLGKMGMLHGALINKINGCSLVAISDTSKMLTKAFQSIMPNVSFFNNYHKMFENSQLDGVIITTPSASHVSIARAAAEKKNWVFC